MASVSYIKQNDYKPQEFRPYELPYNSMVQSAKIRDSFFKTSVASMQQEWSRITGLSPRNINNKAYLEDFEIKALDKFQKVAKGDLTVQGNQALFQSIVDPLYDVSNPTNASLLMDDDLNKHFSEQRRLSDQARTTKGGKSWSEDNDFYWRKEEEKYDEWARTGGDPSKIKDFQKKGFIPYYDYSKELEGISKNCYSGGHEETGAVPGGYTLNVSTKGASAEQMAACIRLGLSPQARQQISMRGYRTYYNDRQQLLSDFEQYQFGASKKMLDDLSVELTQLKLKSNPTAEEKERLTSLQKELPSLLTKYEEEAKVLQGKIGMSLPEYIEQNYENLAGNVYFNKFSQELGAARQTRMTKTKLAADPVQLRYIDFQNKVNFAVNYEYPQEERMLDKRLQNDIFLEQVKSGAKVTWKNGVPSVDYTPREIPVTVGRSDINNAESYEYLTSNAANYEKLAAEKYGVLTDYLKRLTKEERALYNLPDGNLTAEQLFQIANSLPQSTNPAAQQANRIFSEFKYAIEMKDRFTTLMEAIDADLASKGLDPSTKEGKKRKHELAGQWNYKDKKFAIPDMKKFDAEFGSFIIGAFPSASGGMGQKNGYTPTHYYGDGRVAIQLLNDEGVPRKLTKDEKSMAEVNKVGGISLEGDKTIILPPGLMPSVYENSTQNDREYIDASRSVAMHAFEKLPENLKNSNYIDFSDNIYVQANKAFIPKVFTSPRTGIELHVSFIKEGPDFKYKVYKKGNEKNFITFDTAKEVAAHILNF